MSTTPVNIIGIGTYFPNNIKKNADFNYEAFGISENWIKEAGLNERRHANPEEDIFDLAFLSAKRAIINARVKNEEIDVILFVSSSFKANQLVPTGISRLQKKLELSNCLSYHFVDTCCGFISAMELGSSLISSQQARNVLIIASETPSKMFNPNSKMTYKVSMSMGDGSGAIVLSGSREIENGRLGSYVITDPEFVSGLAMRVENNLINNEQIPGVVFGFTGLPPSYEGNFLQPDKALNIIKEYTSKAVPKTIKAALERSQLTRDDIDFYIMHQPNRAFIDAWKERADIPNSKTLDTLDKFGNISSVSVIANLDMAYQLGRIKKGDTICLASIGEGTNMGASIWKWNLGEDENHNYLVREQKVSISEKLISVENYSMLELWEKFVLPGTKEKYTHEELFSEFVPCWAVFENVPIEDAFNFISDIKNLALWTMSMRNIRLFNESEGIYAAEEDASPTGKVYIKGISDKNAKTIEWQCNHSDPNNLWMIYKGMVFDAEKTLGRKGSAFLWTNFIHENAKKDPMLLMGFKMMFAAHRIEINNLKMILEERYSSAYIKL